MLLILYTCQEIMLLILFYNCALKNKKMYLHYLIIIVYSSRRWFEEKYHRVLEFLE